jgi:hypothetical protein
MCQIIIIFCSPVNFFFFTPAKQEKKSEKLQLHFYFFCGKIHHLAMKKGVSKEGKEGFFMEIFDQSRHISR